MSVQSQHRELRFISDTSADLCFYPRSIALGPRNCIIAAHQRYNLRGFMYAYIFQMRFVSSDILDTRAIPTVPFNFICICTHASKPAPMINYPFIISSRSLLVFQDDTLRNRNEIPLHVHRYVCTG